MTVIADNCTKPKRVKSARAAMFLKVGASSGRNQPPSRPTENTFQAVQVAFIQKTQPSWDACNILTSVVARITSSRVLFSIPRGHRVLSANVDVEQEPKMLFTWSETESFINCHTKDIHDGTSFSSFYNR